MTENKSLSYKDINNSGNIISSKEHFNLKYIEEMLPNISSDVIEKQKTLQPGNCVAFGGAFKIPMIVRMDMPDPPPYSSNCDVSGRWGIPQNLPNQTVAQSNTQNAMNLS